MHDPFMVAYERWQKDGTIEHEQALAIHTPESNRAKDQIHHDVTILKSVIDAATLETSSALFIKNLERKVGPDGVLILSAMNMRYYDQCAKEVTMTSAMEELRDQFTESTKDSLHNHLDRMEAAIDKILRIEPACLSPKLQKVLLLGSICHEDYVMLRQKLIDPSYSIGESITKLRQLATLRDTSSQKGKAYVRQRYRNVNSTSTEQDTGPVSEEMVEDSVQRAADHLVYSTISPEGMVNLRAHFLGRQSTTIPKPIWERLDTSTKEKIQEIRRSLDDELKKPSTPGAQTTPSELSKVPKQYSAKANLAATDDDGTVQWADDLVNSGK